MIAVLLAMVVLFALASAWSFLRGSFDEEREP